MPITWVGLMLPSCIHQSNQCPVKSPAAVESWHPRNVTNMSSAVGLSSDSDSWYTHNGAPQYTHTHTQVFTVMLVDIELTSINGGQGYTSPNVSLDHNQLLSNRNSNIDLLHH